MGDTICVGGQESKAWVSEVDDCFVLFCLVSDSSVSNHRIEYEISSLRSFFVLCLWQK